MQKDEQKKKQKNKEDALLNEARQEAKQIIEDAKDVARQIYGASLEYVDDMLSELNLTILREKEAMRISMESILEEFDSRLDLVEGHRQELIELLREHTDSGAKPITKGQYEIKVDKEYLANKTGNGNERSFTGGKTGYEVKITDGTESRVDVYKPRKASYEVKVADEWKERVDAMLAAANEPYIEESLPEPEEEEGEYKASDFDLDSEYFSWLEEKEEN